MIPIVNQSVMGHDYSIVDRVFLFHVVDHGSIPALPGVINEHRAKSPH